MCAGGLRQFGKIPFERCKTLLRSSYLDALGMLFVPDSIKHLGMSGCFLVCSFRSGKPLPSTGLFLRILQNRQLPPKMATAVQTSSELLGLDREVVVRLLEGFNLVHPLLQGTTGLRTTLRRQITVDLAPAPASGCIHAPAPGHRFDLARNRCQQVTPGKLRSVIIGKPGNTLTNPKKASRSSVLWILEDIGDPGLCFISLPEQSVSESDPCIAVASFVPTLLDSVGTVGEFDLRGNRRIAADMRHQAPNLPVP